MSTAPEGEAFAVGSGPRRRGVCSCRRPQKARRLQLAAAPEAGAFAVVDGPRRRGVCSCRRPQKAGRLQLSTAPEDEAFAVGNGPRRRGVCSCRRPQKKGRLQLSTAPEGKAFRRAKQLCAGPRLVPPTRSVGDYAAYPSGGPSSPARVPVLWLPPALLAITRHTRQEGQAAPRGFPSCGSRPLCWRLRSTPARRAKQPRTGPRLVPPARSVGDYAAHPPGGPCSSARVPVLCLPPALLAIARHIRQGGQGALRGSPSCGSRPAGDAWTRRADPFCWPGDLSRPEKQRHAEGVRTRRADSHPRVLKKKQLENGRHRWD